MSELNACSWVQVQSQLCAIQSRGAAPKGPWVHLHIPTSHPLPIMQEEVRMAAICLVQ